MRWTLLLLVYVTAVAAGCDWPGALAGSGTGTGGGDAGMLCSQSNACDTCPNCAANGPCATVTAACNANGACLAIASCVAGCADATCRQGCPSLNPDGAADFQAYEHCVYCTQCPCTGLCM